MLDYAEWLGASAATLNPLVSLLDTTDTTVKATAQHVCNWLARVSHGC